MPPPLSVLALPSCLSTSNRKVGNDRRISILHSIAHSSQKHTWPPVCRGPPASALGIQGLLSSRPAVLPSYTLCIMNILLHAPPAALCLRALYICGAASRNIVILPVLYVKEIFAPEGSGAIIHEWAFSPHL
jgi:hypothetical protein